MDILNILLGALFVVIVLAVIYKLNPWFRKKINKAYGKDDNRPFR